jgi:ribose-phosphate pyrophosphokinase
MKYEIKKYPDGTQYVKVIEFSHNFVFRINSYQDLWTLRQIKDVYDHNKKEVNLIIPCLLDAQADRRFNPDESSGLKIICVFINSMKFKSVSVFHPHNPELVEALLDNVEIIDNYKFINQVIYNELYPGPGFPNTDMYNNLVLLSSDAGGFKPLMKLADKIDWKGETESASKSRKYEDGKSKLIQKINRTNFQGKDILIIDDICVYGGTFIGLANMLKERNCRNLYLAVSHLTVCNPNPDLFRLFDKVFTTNSKGINYINEKGEHPENLFIIEL